MSGNYSVLEPHLSTEAANILAKAIESLSDRTFAEEFQSIAIGIGAILAGLGGLKLFLDWSQERIRGYQIQRLKRAYPINRLNKDYKLVDTQQVPGMWWLLDYRDKTKHWIRNMETVIEMGWVKQRKRIRKTTLDKYRPGKPIDTQ